METLIVGITGILATLISSGLGLYYTSKARTASHRDFLYEHQFKLLVALATHLGRARTWAVMAFSSESPFRERAEGELRDAVAGLAAISEESGLLMPTELYGEFRSLVSSWTEFIAAGEQGHPDLAGLREGVDAQGAKTLLMARSLLGIEELTEETMNLYAQRDSIGRLREVTLEEMLDVAHTSR